MKRPDTSPSKSHDRASVLIIGSGIMGAAIARMVRESDPVARITMIAGGPRIGGIPGQHLHDSPDPDVRRTFNRNASVNSQNLYMGSDLSESVAQTARQIGAGMTSIGAIGDDGHEMPGAAIAWNEGGMSVHWAGGAPFPSGDEVPSFLDSAEWQLDLEASRRLLRVTPDAFPLDGAARAILGVLDSTVGAPSPDGLRAQRMPMALERMPDGRILRTGPNRILPAMTQNDDPLFTLVADTVCTRILVEDGRATGAETRQLTTGERGTIEADAVVVAADALRTPQLLFASGVRPEGLGRYLNEHAFVSGAVVVSPEALGLDQADVAPPNAEEPFTNSLWVPQAGSRQPFHAGLLCRAHRRPDGSPCYLVTLSWYVPTDISPDNRVMFSDDERDAQGMPRMRLAFGYSDADLEMIARARASQAVVARELSGDATGHHSTVLPPGSSLHYTGTVRMGTRDDGTSVCDTDGRIWGYDNLYVVGNGVVPTALACNSTLTALVLATRTGRAVARDLRGKTRSVAGAGVRIRSE